jgi:hypothetical protein
MFNEPGPSSSDLSCPDCTSVRADMIFRGRNGADAYLTGFLRAILKAQDSATRDLAVANFRGELRTRRLNVADIAIIVRPLVN